MAGRLQDAKDAKDVKDCHMFTLLDVDESFAILHSLAKLLESGKHSDVVIVTKEKKEIHAHRLILSMHSPVFEAMFMTHKMKEQFDGKVILDDVDYEVCLALVKFMYGVRPHLSSTTSLCHLILAGDRFCIGGLRGYGVEKLSGAITAENVTEIILFTNIADEWSSTQIKKDVEKFILTDLSVVQTIMNQDQYKQFTAENKEWLLKICANAHSIAKRTREEMEKELHQLTYSDFEVSPIKRSRVMGLPRHSVAHKQV